MIKPKLQIFFHRLNDGEAAKERVLNLQSGKCFCKAELAPYRTLSLEERIGGK